VLVIDDLQWGDADSAALVLELLRAPAPLFLLASHRAIDEAAAPWISALRELAREAMSEPRFELRELTLGPLEAVEASALAYALYTAGLRRDEENLPPQVESYAQRMASAIARES